MEDARQRMAMHQNDSGGRGDTLRPIEVLLQEAPIRRMPPEILRLFFTFAKSSYLGICVPSRKSPLLSLLQVCSSWRSIALATPDLWTALCIFLRPSTLHMDPAIVRRYEELASQWFSRAGPHSGLSLQFKHYHYDKRHDFSGTILLHCRQIRELKIWLLDPNPLATFMRGDRNDSYEFPQLEDLSIHCINPGVDVTFAAAGRLRRVTTKIRFPSWEARRSFAPWEQLTCLEIRSL